MQRLAGPLHPSEPQLVAGAAGMLEDARVDATEWVGDRAAGACPQAGGEDVARAPQLGSHCRIVQPGQAAMCGAVGGEIEPARLPALDFLPAEVLEPVPGIAHIPGVGLANVIGDQKRGGGEAEVCQDGIGVIGEGGVAVVE